VLALKTLFEPSAGFEASVELRLGEQRFHARVAGGRLAIARGPAERPDATIEGEPGPLAAALWHGQPLEATIEGDRELAARFLDLFPAPG
jgi:hypothetical protein